MNHLLPISKRKLRRTRLYLKAQVKTGTGTTEVRVRDISCAGALVEATATPALHAVVQLIWEKNVLDACVAWTDGCWFGLKFEQELSGELHKQLAVGLKMSAPRGYRRDGADIENERPH